MKDETFQIIWEKLIQPTYAHLENINGGIMLPPSSSGEIHSHYEELVAHAKKRYMADPNGVLNRHKVSAALMIAILKVKPIKKIDPLYYTEDETGVLRSWTFNESLAITVSLSVLRAFIEARVKYAFSGKKLTKSIFEDVCWQDQTIFENGIPISDKEREDWEWELYQIRQDGAYNVLSMAHVLSGIEKTARAEYFMRNVQEQPIYPNSALLIDEQLPMLTLDQILGTE